MKATGGPPGYVVEVFLDLQRRRALALGLDDLLALRRAVEAGFGWESDVDLVELCVALWASSPADADLVRTLFARHLAEGWHATAEPGEVGPRRRRPGAAPDPVGAAPERVVSELRPETLTVEGTMEVPPLPVEGIRRVVLSLEFPVARRDVAQAFRRLRQPVRTGPAVELDVDATIVRRARAGAATAPVLVPRARRFGQLLLLIDRGGSMAPFHPYLDHVRDAVLDDSGLEHVEVAYFHNSPGPRIDRTALEGLGPGLVPDVGPVVAAVTGGVGSLYRDPELTEPVAIEDLADAIGAGVGVAVLSDNGASSDLVDLGRLVSALSFAKHLRAQERRLVWLNPVPRDARAGTTAEHLGRYTPQFTLDRPGLHQAVDVLRGRIVRLDGGT